MLEVLTTPTDLLVSCFTLCYSSIVVISCRNLPGETLVDLHEPLSEDTYIILNLSLLLFFLKNLLLELVSFRTQVFNA